MAKVHIQEPIYGRLSLCGKPWGKVKGGQVASDGFVPPIVKNAETGSLRAATCAQCLLVLRRSKFTPRP